MQSQEEKMLLISKVDYDNIPIPNDIDDYILKGLKTKRKTKKNRIALYASTAAVIALFLLASAARMSPVFAGYLDNVPILKYIVKLVNYDKGLKSAVDNNFVQNINASDEHGDIKLTVDNIIIDQARMIVFYTIENNSSYKYLDIEELNFTDKARKDLEVFYGFDYYCHNAEQHNIEDRINISFPENFYIPDTIHFELELNHKNSPDSTNKAKLPYTWQIDIPIDKSKFENLKEVYNIDQTIEIENQKITFKKAIIYPTRIEVQVEFAKENTKKILSFDKLKILNEKGELLSAIINDATSSIPDENHVNLFFESNYFSKPKNLYLQGSSIRALGKDKLEVIVDTEKKKLIKAPDNNISLYDVTKADEGTTLSFLLKADEKLDDKFSYFVFKHVISDAKNIESGYCNLGTYGSGLNQEITITIPKDFHYKNPLTLTIEDYPTRIKGDFKVKIK